ncbi:MAG: FAD-dependent oxidoreductase [Bacteroidia bacterium]|nr:FAD-dependent oxidoreductase [Bacteroidia bacterium]
MVTLTINNQEIEVNDGITLLTAIESIGINVPTLCYHKALIPYGACRLCVVEVQLPGRASSLQAACTYPVSNGIQVFTDTERIFKARKIVAELHLARCPDSEPIKKIAREYGITEPRIKTKNEDCILCGLCVRMCEERMGRSAIGFTGRGSNRKQETPFGKHNEMCWICGACNFICPVGKKVQSFTSDRHPIPIPDSFNTGLNERSAVSILYPQAIPNKPAIDNSTCLQLNYEVCGICKEVCEAEAIDYEQVEEKIELNVGAVVLAFGYEVYDAEIKKELGYDRFPNVVTSLEFERILSASGPYLGEILRPSDSTHPKKIAFIQCVGSRDPEKKYCSSVCCMYATKEAIIAKEHEPDIECSIFYIDLRAFGKGFDEYYERAKKLGIKYIRCRPSGIKEVPGNSNLKLQYQAADGNHFVEEFDLIVLSVGLKPPKDIQNISDICGVDLNEFGFLKSPFINPVETNREGIFKTGVITEPKDIPESVMEASAAASKVMGVLSDVRGSLITFKEFPPETDVTDKEPRIGVFVCHCGINIAGVVNVPSVVEYAKTLPNVVYAENNLYTCSNDAQKRIIEKISEFDLNRVVVASCSPRTHEPLFQSTIREAGLNPYLFEMANIRDQCSWVHMFEPEKATLKSKDLLRIALAKVRLKEALERKSLPINQSALVIGGGLSGMSASIDIATAGCDVHLIEKEEELGGNLKHIFLSLNGEKPQNYLNEVLNHVKSNSRIKTLTSCEIVSIEGSIGDFKTTVSTNGTQHVIKHGVIIVATGGKENIPIEYEYGKDNRILTQTELEAKLYNTLNPDSVESARTTDNLNLKSVVMINCVGSRDEERPYCSRICCTHAIKNALKIKEINPDSKVYILYRDIRTYGFKETYYREAREKGIIFIRYNTEKKPVIISNNGSIKISTEDPVFNKELILDASTLVLSTGIIPNPDSKDLAQLLKVPLNQNGFFLEAHMKLRPVEFATEGVFLCGLSHSPKSIEESVSQASAAAAKAMTILSNESIELDATISNVVDENCDGCAYCIEPCPYEALTLIEYMRDGSIKKTVETNESLCQGCGVCMATCPKKGIYVRNFKLEMIAAQVAAALEPVE